MRSLKCRLCALALGAAILGAGGFANAASTMLTDQEMEGVTAGGVMTFLANTGAISVSTSQAVSTSYFNFIIGLNAGMHTGLNNNGISWNLVISRQ